MDIYLTSIASGERLRIPLLPDRLSIRTSSSTVSVNVIKTGEVKIPRGSMLTGYSWSGVLPGERMANSSFVFDWQEPPKIRDMLRAWMEAGETLRLVVTELSINDDVFIESCNFEHFGIDDISYTLTLTKRRTLTITTVKVPTLPVTPPGKAPFIKARTFAVVNANGVKVREKPGKKYKVLGTLKKGAKVELLAETGNWLMITYDKGVDGKAYIHSKYIKRTSSSGSGGGNSGGGNGGNGGGTYTVKVGDTLYKIAASKLGSGARMYEIYNLNKSAIDAANKGKRCSKYTVYPGMTLKLPSSSSGAKSTKTTRNKQVVITKPSATKINVKTTSVVRPMIK